MPTIDKCAEVVANSTYALAILGNPSTADFQLVTLEGKPLSQDRRSTEGRGLEFIGVAGLVGAELKVSVENPAVLMSKELLAALTEEFKRAMAEEIQVMSDIAVNYRKIEHKDIRSLE